MFRLIFVLLGITVSSPALAQVAGLPRTVAASAFVDVVVSPGRAAVGVQVLGDGLSAASAVAAADSVRAQLELALEPHHVELIPWGAAQGENQAVRRMISGPMDVRTSRDHIARQLFTVSLEEAAQASVIARDLAAAGANGGISIQYYPDASDPKLEEALAEATRVAHQRAVAIADAAGSTLGPLQTLSTPGLIGQQSLLRMSLSDPSGVQITPSEVMVRVQVNGVWLIGDP